MSPRNGASPYATTRPLVVKIQYPSPEGVADREVTDSPRFSAGAPPA
jgi:hypothetical protein